MSMDEGGLVSGVRLYATASGSSNYDAEGHVSESSRTSSPAIFQQPANWTEGDPELYPPTESPIVRFGEGLPGSEVNYGVTIFKPPLDHSDRDHSYNGGGNYFSSATGQALHGEERNWLVVGVLITLIIILWLVLGAMLCVPLVRCIKRRLPVSQKRINRRYETIEGWLITKTVKPHDETCEQIQAVVYPKASPRQTGCIATSVHEATKNRSDSPAECSLLNSCKKDKEGWVTQHDDGEGDNVENPARCSGMKHTDSYDTADTTVAIDYNCVDNDEENENNKNEGWVGEDKNLSEGRECPVCMEFFVVGDIVSWTSSEKCSHVYHHQCIKEWLLRHNNCPFCREVFLPVDEANGKVTLKLFHEMSSARAKRANRTYYCIQDGLVNLQGHHGRYCNHAIANPMASISLSTGVTPDSSSSGSTVCTSSLPSLFNQYSLAKRDQHQLSETFRSDYPSTRLVKDKLRPGVTTADLRKLRGDRCEKIYYGDTDHLDIIDDPCLVVDEDEGSESDLNLSLDAEEKVIDVELGHEPTSDNDSSLDLPGSTADERNATSAGSDVDANILQLDLQRVSEEVQQ